MVLKPTHDPKPTPENLAIYNGHIDFETVHHLNIIVSVICQKILKPLQLMHTYIKQTLVHQNPLAGEKHLKLYQSTKRAYTKHLQVTIFAPFTLKSYQDTI
jgi:hypothetical protein